MRIIFVQEQKKNVKRKKSKEEHIWSDKTGWKDMLTMEELEYRFSYI